MANFEIEGRLTHKLESQSGQSARGAWTKQSFVVEYQDGNYPAKVCFTVFGDEKVSELGKYKVGDQIKVAFNVKAREYNGKWYNDVNVWKFIPLKSQGAAAPSGDDLPPVPTVPPPSANGFEIENDDLPF